MDLTNEQWHAIQGFIPPPHTGRGRPPVEVRSLLNGILLKLRTDITWHAIPSQYPSHQTCYRYYCEWSSSGVFKTLCNALYMDLLFRGGFTPYQAVKDRQIVWNVRRRKFKLYTEPASQNDWRVNTALLLMRVELHSALKRLIKYAKTHPDQSIAGAKIILRFSKWPHFAPQGHETYTAPEDIIIPLT